MNKFIVKPNKSVKEIIELEGKVMLKECSEKSRSTGAKIELERVMRECESTTSGKY